MILLKPAFRYKLWPEVPKKYMLDGLLRNRTGSSETMIPRASDHVTVWPAAYARNLLPAASHARNDATSKLSLAASGLSPGSGFDARKVQPASPHVEPAPPWCQHALANFRRKPHRCSATLAVVLKPKSSEHRASPELFTLGNILKALQSDHRSP